MAAGNKGCTTQVQLNTEKKQANDTNVEQERKSLEETLPIFSNFCVCVCVFFFLPVVVGNSILGMNFSLGKNTSSL